MFVILFPLVTQRFSTCLTHLRVDIDKYLAISTPQITRNLLITFFDLDDVAIYIPKNNG